MYKPFKFYMLDCAKPVMQRYAEAEMNNFKSTTRVLNGKHKKCFLSSLYIPVLTN